MIVFKILFCFYVYNNRFNCSKQLYFSRKLLYLSKNTCQRNLRKAFNTKFGHQWKYRESSYQVRQILVHFALISLVALILGSNYIKDLTITKTLKQSNFKVSGQSKKQGTFSSDNHSLNIFRQTLLSLTKYLEQIGDMQ